jgi:hypothetical protein
LQLQQVHELAALARHFGPAIDWRFVERRLGEHRLTPPLQSYLLACRKLFGLEWPLEAPPSVGSQLHFKRCELQLSIPPLQSLGVPLANLRATFAWHRMRALYGTHGRSLNWRGRHLLRYLRKNGVGAAVGRLLRVD